MKKHHLFLLIVCLLLVASLAFPATDNPIIYEISNLKDPFKKNNLPEKIREHDVLYIKKIMNHLSKQEGTHISIQIFKHVIGKAPTPFDFNDTTVWIKGGTDEIAQEYYNPSLAIGTYDFIFTTFKTSGSGSVKAPITIPHHTIEVVAANSPISAQAIPPTPATHAIIYETSNLNDFPGKIIENDLLFIKKIMDQFSDQEGQQVHFKILNEIAGKAPIPFHFNDTTVWIKSSADEAAQEYYALPPLPTGTYKFEFTNKKTAGSGALPTSTIYNREVKVISATNLVEVQKIRGGDNDT